jgi:alkanesulfonate monooxygenase SsuD/methylene tetrahydromethanopterin reductase-like flavin-dependent oxidoreductase (luciferase family)
MMATLNNGRIDLGIGRAPGGTGLTSQALAYPHQPHHGDLYAQQAQMLAGFVNANLPAEHPYSRINVLPDSIKPELWMLGSSGGSAGLAGHLGYNIALARFIDPDNCHPSIFDAYRDEWKQAPVCQPNPEPSCAPVRPCTANWRHNWASVKTS